MQQFYMTSNVVESLTNQITNENNFKFSKLVKITVMGILI